jgi:hypothetical protein
MDEDVPNTTREYGGKEFRLRSESLQFLGIFRCGSILAGSIFQDTSRWISDRRPSLKVWQFEKKPPLKPLLELDSHGTNIPVYGLQPGLSFGPDVY